MIFSSLLSWLICHDNSLVEGTLYQTVILGALLYPAHNHTRSRHIHLYLL